MITALGLVLALASAGAESGRAVGVKANPDTARAVSTRAKSDGVDTGSAKAVATRAKTDALDTSRAVSTKAAGIDTDGGVATRAVRDTSETHHLPPRTLPLKRQMMFAGGFMVFIALMMTSLQNFNPND